MEILDLPFGWYFLPGLFVWYTVAFRYIIIIIIIIININIIIIIKVPVILGLESAHWVCLLFWRS